MVFNQEFRTQLNCLSLLTLKYVLLKKKKKSLQNILARKT